LLEDICHKAVEHPDMNHVRRVVISVVGFTVLLLGVALVVLPGPAILVIPAGLAILAGEFVWARRLYKKMQDLTKKISGSNS
jgi:tellurite resistance protein TerC